VSILLIGYLALGLLLGGVYFLLSELSQYVIIWGLLGTLAVAATLTGVRRNRPNVRRPWYLIATGQACFALGDVIKQAAPASLADVGDLFYLISYATLTAALLGFVRARTAGRDLPALLDAFALTTGLGLLVWTVIMTPYARDPALSLEAKLISFVLPLADIVLLAVLLRLWSGGGERRPPYYLLGFSIAALLGADVALGVATVQGTFQPGSVIDTGWMAFLIASGCAALHPSMGSISAAAAPSDLQPTPRRLAVLAGASLIAPAVLMLQWARGQEIDAPVIAASCVVLFLIPMVRIFWLAAEVTRQTERKGLLGRILQATEEERTRIASDLHDGPVQQLAILSYNAHRARKQLAKQDLVAADGLLDKVEQSLESEVKVLRRLMSDLRPPILDNRGLEAALVEHVSAFERERSIMGEIQVDLSDRLAPELETVLYRVVQESLNNVAKHSQASNVSIRVRTDEQNVHLRIRDDGVGFDTSHADELLREGHFGLAGMRERVGLAGGHLELRSTPGKGTTVEVMLPLAPVAAFA
jgi:signal transduction histidine kinase